ncbi:MAG: hypothetical protein SFY81_06920 [Verrucomicrobiota bacterium]|nr:hypothetical protein [Verrucomicrobiota bacterium]
MKWEGHKKAGQAKLYRCHVHERRLKGAGSESSRGFVRGAAGCYGHLVRTILVFILAIGISTATAVHGAQTNALSLTNKLSEEDLEYYKVLAEDEAASKEVDKWIRDNEAFLEKGAGQPVTLLGAKVEQRLEAVRKSYQRFLERYPNHVEGRLAYGSFLNEIHEEAAAVKEWEKAKSLDPTNPAAWNNLANYYGHRGPVTNAFTHYEKAISLRTNEPVYLQNLATVVYLFRKDAKEYYKIDEQQVFDKALALYADALKLNPTNILFATALAESYYGIKPPRYEAAIAAWNDALKLAKNDLERQGVYIHLARNELNSGRFDAARQHLDLVTVPEFQEMKQRLERNLEKKREESAEKAKSPGSAEKPTEPKK